MQLMFTPLTCDQQLAVLAPNSVSHPVVGVTHVIPAVLTSRRHHVTEGR